MEEITDRTSHQAEENVAIKPAEELKLNSETLKYFSSIYKWTRFLAIAGFVYVGFLVLMALLWSTILTLLSGSAAVAGNATFATGAAVESISTSISLLVTAGIMLMLMIFLYNFSVKMKKALILGDSDMLASSFKSLKDYYMVYGILIIISMAFLLFVFIFGAMATAVAM